MKTLRLLTVLLLINSIGIPVQVYAQQNKEQKKEKKEAERERKKEEQKEKKAAKAMRNRTTYY